MIVIAPLEKILRTVSVRPLLTANLKSILMSSGEIDLPLLMKDCDVSKSFKDLLTSRQFMKDMQSKDKNIFSCM